MGQKFVSINGVIIPESEAMLHITDLSIQRGYGIFDFFRTIQNQPVFLDDHLDRFFYSASQMHLHAGLNREQLIKDIYALIAVNGIDDSGIRITLTGGYSPDGYQISAPNLLITQSAFGFQKQNFEKGIRLMTHNYQRQLSRVKTLDYLQAIYLQPVLRQNQADDILYHHNGALRECPRANFFIVKINGEILTPAEDILHGITRKKILTFTNLGARERPLTLADLDDINEAFISSSTREVLPVMQIDGKPVGNGIPGPVTTAIYERLRNARIADARSRATNTLQHFL